MAQPASNLRTEDILSYSEILSSFLLALQQHSSLGLAGELLEGSSPMGHMATGDSVIHMLSGITNIPYQTPLKQQMDSR